MGLEDLNRRLSQGGMAGPLPIKKFPGSDKPAPTPPALRFQKQEPKEITTKTFQKKIEKEIPAEKSSKELNLAPIDFSTSAHVSVGSRKEFRYGMNKFLKGSISHATRRAAVIDKIMDSTVSGRITKHGFNRAVRSLREEGHLSRGEMTRLRRDARSFN